MTNQEAIEYWNNHYEVGNTEQNEAVYKAISALFTLNMIRSIINMPHIQEDVMRYKMICEVVRKGESE